MEDDLVLTDPWWDLRGGGPTEEKQRKAIQAELLAEVSRGHPLSGAAVEVIGRSEASDDVLLRAGRRGWAVVHLTWRGAAEPPPWPRVAFYASVQEVEDIH
jgi:hypothetical protein